jgi:hypothetical protein
VGGFATTELLFFIHDARIEPRTRVKLMGQGIRAGQTVSSIPYGFDRYGRPLKIWRRRKDLSLGESLRYPLVDGPGIALLVLLPPFLAFMALPVLDLVVQIKPENALSPIALLVIPFSLPLVISFSLTIGYLLLFLGRMLSASAVGESDHPRFPIWDRLEIVEELTRWTWTCLVGLGVGWLPALLYFRQFGSDDGLHRFFLAALAAVGLAYAPMAFMTALLHDSWAAANPLTVIRSIGRVGPDYLRPCLVVAATMGVDLAGWLYVLFRSPNPTAGLVGLWACWVFTLYAAMMLVRLLGTHYYRHEARLAWFRTTKG